MFMAAWRSMRNSSILLSAVLRLDIALHFCLDYNHTERALSRKGLSGEAG